MSIPSNLPPNTPPTPPSNQPPTSYMDPTGAWAKFLSTSGAPATAQDVKIFLQGIMKMFNVVIQQQQAAAARANEQLKKAASGEE
jgi:hypothetical protein